MSQPAKPKGPITQEEFEKKLAPALDRYNEPWQRVQDPEIDDLYARWKLFGIEKPQKHLQLMPVAHGHNIRRAIGVGVAVGVVLDIAAKAIAGIIF